MLDVRSLEQGSIEHSDRDSEHIMSISSRRRRSFQRQACLLSVMAAFTLGLALGVFIPLIGISSASIERMDNSIISSPSESSQRHIVNLTSATTTTLFKNFDKKSLKNKSNINKILNNNNIINKNKLYSSVSFVTDDKLRADEVFRNAFHLEQNNNDDSMLVKKLDPNDGSIKEFSVQRTVDGYFRKGPEIKISKPSLADEILLQSEVNDDIPIGVGFVKHGNELEFTNSNDEVELDGIIENDVYWGPTIENQLPKGFENEQTDDWNKYINEVGVVIRLETGCGRMQNRMVIFQDGKRACARYRQNTDQIQGELFSFYLGKVLNITNLAPSTASVIDLNMDLWSSAAQDIANAQWKIARPVVITKWVTDLEPAGIPVPFQPLERHLNKFDVKNITLGLDVPKPPRNLLDRLGGNTNQLEKQQQPTSALSKQTLTKLIELAQWSDLIVFDYLIANLDRVVNNLYNFQWNADIMAAPAHNLAKQTDSELLVFLDNESGLLHGYRLLKKYEAYHGLLLDNLCVFRKPTITALQTLQEYGIGRKLQDVFETSTNLNIRDVLPPLPDKSIKILNDRIDRVLGQVQKCRELFSTR